MNYVEPINAAEFIAQMTKSMQPLMADINKSLPTMFANTTKQLSETIKPISYAAIAKNLQPLFPTSAIKIVSDVQREQMKFLSSTLAQTSKINAQHLREQLNQSFDSNESHELIDEEKVEVPIPVETKTNHQLIWEKFTRTVAWVLNKIVEHYADYLCELFDLAIVFPLFLKMLHWFALILSQLW